MLVLLLISLQVFWSSGLISDLTSSLTSDLISSLIVSLAVSFIGRLTECPSIEYVGRICWSLRILSRNNGKLLHFSVAHMEQARSSQSIATASGNMANGRIVRPSCTSRSHCRIVRHEMYCRIVVWDPTAEFLKPNMKNMKKNVKKNAFCRALKNAPDTSSKAHEFTVAVL